MVYVNNYYLCATMYIFYLRVEMGNFTILTFTEEVMFYSLFVCVFVCLSASSLA